MNTNTGEIRELYELNMQEENIRNTFVEVVKENMTEKQRKTRKVSLHDNKSKLGKQFTEIRKSRIMQRNQRR